MGEIRIFGPGKHMDILIRYARNADPYLGFYNKLWFAPVPYHANVVFPVHHFNSNIRLFNVS